MGVFRTVKNKTLGSDQHYFELEECRGLAVRKANVAAINVVPFVIGNLNHLSLLTAINTWKGDRDVIANMEHWSWIN